MKNPQEIEAMKIRLARLFLTLERFNRHGESNSEAIDCQFTVLEHQLTEDDCWNQWPTHHQEQDLYNRQRALEAARWLWKDGEDLIELWQRERTKL